MNTDVISTLRLMVFTLRGHIGGISTKEFIMATKIKS